MYSKEEISKLLEESWSICAPYAVKGSMHGDVAVRVYEREVATQKPVVSVLVLAWRHERYIDECIESICEQDVSVPFEVIIGEDCSPDGTRDRCFLLQKKYSNLVRLVCSDVNVGFVENMRRIAAIARGKYIAVCEGDDFWVDKKKIEKEIAILESDENITLIHTGAFMQYEHAKWSRCPATNRTIRRILETNPLSATEQRQMLLSTGNFIQTPTVMCSAKAFQFACQRIAEVGDKSGWLPSADFIWWNLCMLHGRAYFIKDNTAVRRINSGSLTAISNSKVANARIIGDIRNALFLALEEDGDRVVISNIVNRLRSAIERYYIDEKLKRCSISPLRLLLKKIVIKVIGL